MIPHAYVDLSKRRPYICGTCRLDIKHPIHQPELQGMTFVIPQREEPEEMPAAPPPRINQIVFAFEEEMNAV